MSVQSGSELGCSSTTELAELIRSKQASSHEVVEAHLRRIEACNPRVTSEAQARPVLSFTAEP